MPSELGVKKRSSVWEVTPTKTTLPAKTEALDGSAASAWRGETELCDDGEEVLSNFVEPHSRSAGDHNDPSLTLAQTPAALNWPPIGNHVSRFRMASQKLR